MMDVMRQVEVAAPTDATVFIAGESGTGKELVARTVHELSPRRRGPFVAVNCAAIPETLLESEIFGHERGSFTGAVERRQGCFELADGGTLFLDEVAEMQPGTQAKFLRVLQEGQFRRLGAKAEIRGRRPGDRGDQQGADEGAAGRHPARGPLLSAQRLRDRRCRRCATGWKISPTSRRRSSRNSTIVTAVSVRGVDESALDVLRRHRWPGNVRELRNVIERAVIVCSGDLVRAEHLPSLGTPTEPVAAAIDTDLVLPIGTTVDDAERELILRTLKQTGGNKTRAAEILGISLKTLHNKLHRYKT